MPDELLNLNFYISIRCVIRGEQVMMRLCQNLDLKNVK